MSDYPLNKAQQEAVEYVDGPLLIVAGAGTGKTSVITKKICYLLENNLAKPEEILALTFTDKAAEEMRDRVEEMAKTSYTDIAISTFHTFCQSVLEHHGLDIGISNRFRLLKETEAWILLKQNLPKLKLDYYRPLGNPLKHIYELLKHFSKCKDELITPEEYLAYAENAKLDSDDVFADVPAEIARLKEVANAYHVYNQLLIDNGALDFGDLIFYAHKLFAERPNILKKYQKQYRYILVDEFQDVNWAQYQLTKRLAEHSQLTVVGDDDQSVYSFRNANVAIILRFKEDFIKAKKIVLTTNYRSRQEILDAAYHSIKNNNPDRLEVKLNIDKKLRAAVKAPGPGIVEHLSSNTSEEEVGSVFKKIAELKKADRKLGWDDFAILVRANSQAEPFVSYCETADIPYEFLAAAGLYRQPIVLDCFNFFKALDDIHDSSAVFRLLGLPFLALRVNDLQKITTFAKKKSISYYEALKRGAELDLSAEGKTGVDKLVAALHGGLKRAQFEKPSIVLYHFLDEIGYLKHLTGAEEQGDEKIIRQIFHLKQFFEYLTQFETATPEARVNNFLEHFNMALDAGDRGALYQPGETPNSLNIMTIHRSKGLEFEYVFIVNLVEDRFPARNRGDGLEIPTALAREQLPIGDSRLEEERRLFYVALTRAKRGVFLTSARNYGGVRAKKISRFAAELGFAENDKLLASDKTLETAALAKHGETAAADAEKIYELPRAFSFSQIGAYQTCPYKYKLGHVLSIPTRGNASFSFGQTMHNTLQQFYGRIQELNAQQQGSLFDQPTRTKAKKGAGSAPIFAGRTPTIIAPPFDDLLKMYDQSWIGDWYQSKNQRESYYEKGKQILKTFYHSQEKNWTRPANLESWFKIKVGEYTIHGRIDRIDQLTDKSLEIIDYKTGTPKEKLTAEDKAQLLIYQMAVSEVPEYRSLGPPSRLTYYYLDNDSRLSFIGKAAELEDLKQKLIGTIDRIQSRDFAATPSKFACDHCEFRDICDYRV